MKPKESTLEQQTQDSSAYTTTKRIISDLPTYNYFQYISQMTLLKYRLTPNDNGLSPLSLLSSFFIKLLIASIKSHLNALSLTFLPTLLLQLQPLNKYTHTHSNQSNLIQFFTKSPTKTKVHLALTPFAYQSLYYNKYLTISTTSTRPTHIFYLVLHNKNILSYKLYKS